MDQLETEGISSCHSNIYVLTGLILTSGQTLPFLNKTTTMWMNTFHLKCGTEIFIEKVGSRKKMADCILLPAILKLLASLFERQIRPLPPGGVENISSLLLKA